MGNKKCRRFCFPVFSNTVENEGLYGFYNIPEYTGESLTVVGRGAGLGTAFKRSGGYRAIGRLLVLFPIQSVDSKYLTDFINHKVKIHTESGGIPQLTGISFSKYRIPLPPSIREQRAIATALSDVDALIAGLDQLIAKKRDLKQAAMQQLLTGQKRLPGFQGEWAAYRFSDFAIPRKDRMDPKRTNEHRFCIELEHIDPGTGQVVRGYSNQFPSLPQNWISKGRRSFWKIKSVSKKYWLANCAGVCSTEIWAFVSQKELIMPDFLIQLVKDDRFIEIACSSYGTHMPPSSPTWTPNSPPSNNAATKPAPSNKA